MTKNELEEEIEVGLEEVQHARESLREAIAKEATLLLKLTESS
jgi:hypothetical protein